MNQKLGNISTFTIVKSKICVVNMVAQRGIRCKPIRYEALEICLHKVANIFREHIHKVSIHMPRIGCGLAGGKWEIVQELVEKTLVNKGFKVTVYDL